MMPLRSPAITLASEADEAGQNRLWCHCVAAYMLIGAGLIAADHWRADDEIQLAELG